jgi:AmiR/NasT family two-component response regulator
MTILHSLEIGLLLEPGSATDAMIRALQRLRCNITHIWPMPATLPGKIEMIICTLDDDLPQRIPWLPGEPEAALVIIDSGIGELDLKLIRNCGAHGMLQPPIDQRNLQANLCLALDRYQYESRLRARIQKLDENLRSSRLIERAKTLLAKSKSITEDEAYAMLRKQSMEQRVAIGTIAQAVVDAHDFNI